MRVVFLSPSYPPEMQQYTRGLAEVGAQVFGVGDTPREALPRDVRPHLHDYLQVPRIMDEDDVIERVSAWLRGREIDRVLANWEPLVVLAARMRERWGVPGMSVDTVRAFRDKQLMKERVAAAGLRVPRAFRIRTASEAREAAERIGFPVVIKPISGAGSADTYRVASSAELESALAKMDHVVEASVEEYVEGEEHTYDTVCIGGAPVYENVARYLPKPLEARTHEWISPVIVTVRDLGQRKLQPGVALGRDVLRALGMGDGFTHMEWFLTPKGEAVFGEIGCRPGGAHLVDQMNYTSDVDLFREWARAVCWHAFEGRTERKFNVAIVFKRAKGQGRITRIEGLEAWKRACAPYVVEDALLRPGTPRRNWKQTLLSDGHVVVRHPDWDETVRMATLAATDITMYAE
ncbi:ATP-grasp domain-containing protein [Sandaracinus amylolyticus]|uniref:Carbamoylphosphate synthase large subunit protein n=1 Tax=Sandaracinus amylolyticus TaxID=927083 RepID=A0A0F6YG75_9BACT|nr:ATP-grasp domain-containing protein [Sandaracinus amylolyticus]AKF03528.1 Carbamoylphosphate synthase large subunit protein [Sandaracinus amylolyticus]